MKKRKNRRKVFIIMVLSLSLCMGLFSSYAAVTDDDATITFKRTPISVKGWITYVNSQGISTTGFSDSYFNFSIQAGNAGFLWRITGNFDNFPDFVHNRLMSIIGWAFDSTLDFNVDFVYQFKLQIRYGNTGGQSLFDDVDFSKLYLGFSSDQSFYMKHTFTTLEADSAISALFSPSSYTVNGQYIELVYNIPIYPTSNFPTAVTDVDSGVTYVPVYNMYLWNYNSGLDYFSTNGTLTRMQYTIFPRTASDASVFTPSEWQTHVQQQGFDDISKAITLQGENIVNAIDDQTDQILNSGDPIDDSGLYSAHQVEHNLVNAIYSTSAYTPAVGTTLATGMANFVAAAKPAVSNWLQYVFQTNGFANLIVWGAYFSICIFLAMKAVF